ncbi:MAG: hypothetical protein SO445_00260 [Lachnospiraceae bacterium]|nr:hypothetical protein [Lachnospiraceae bacterium]MDD7377802.1 hypothetical protein [Lachnospiraceae bacterium]MDY4616137.1 hypothetical protein [Lachnospiraceae bacterium]
MNNMKTFFTNKKVAIPVIFIVVLVIAVITGFSVHNAQVAKEKAEAEKKAKAHLEELTGEFDTAKFRIENAILEDEERTNLLESLNGYEKKLDGISKEDEKEFDTLCTSIEEKYTASAATLDNAVAGITTTYPTEEGYYTEEFTASVTTLMDELNTLKADGKYQKAFDKFNEINGTYAAYVEQVNAQRAAAEEAAKKAEAETNKKNSSSTSTEKNNNKESTDNVFSEDRSYPSGYDSYEEYQESLAAKAQANAQGYPVPYGNGFIPPDGWTVDQIFDWAHANGY